VGEKCALGGGEAGALTGTLDTDTHPVFSFSQAQKERKQRHCATDASATGWGAVSITTLMGKEAGGFPLITKDTSQRQLKAMHVTYTSDTSKVAAVEFLFDNRESRTRNTNTSDLIPNRNELTA
jgi:hypothetical protein